MIARADFYRRPSRGVSSPPRTLRIALLGCGVVGSATARLLTAQRERLRKSHAIDLQLKRILVRDAGRPRKGIDPTLFTTSFDDVLAAEPNVIIEALGRREPAATYIERALERGISVVSANKTAIAHDGVRLQAIADAAGSRLAYEASVGAAIPVLAALRQRAAGGERQARGAADASVSGASGGAGDPVLSLRAVVNGTCNFILARMRGSGLPLQDVLKEAIERGYAEPDPTADISGRDSAEKLCILARAAGIAGVTPIDIDITGIADITPRDLEAAREQGCVVRLIAELECRDGAASLRVCPMFVPTSHPLAKARGAENVFVIEQQFAGRLVLQGEGAGPLPTAAAVLGDVLCLLEPAAPSAPSTPVARRAAPSPGRAFVRLPRGHESAHALRQGAMQVHVRRDTIEAIVDDQERALIGGAFVAPFLT